MICKKYYFLLCFIFSLILVQILSGTCLAYTYTLTPEDCETIISYYYPSNTKSYENILAYFKAQVEYAQSNYDVVFLGVRDTSHPTYHIVALNNTQITSIGNLNDINYMNITFTGTAYERVCVGNGPWYDPQWSTPTNSNTTVYINAGAQTNGLYLMYNADISGVTDGPYQNWNLLSFVQPTYFKIDLNTNSNTQYFSVTTATNELISNIAVLDSNNFGTFYDNTFMAYDSQILNMWYWDGSYWIYKNLLNQTGINNVDNMHDNQFLSYDGIYSDDIQIDITLNNLFAFKNVIYEYYIHNVDGDSAYGYFLIGDNYTSINNGSIDTSNFPSGYFDQFSNLDNMINNNDNTQNIINAIGSGNALLLDDSDVEGMLSEFLSGDEASIGATLGYHNYYNQYNDVYWGFVEAFTNVFYTSGDPYIAITMRDGTNRRIYASEFITPNTEFKIFISSILVTLYCMVMFEVVRKWYIDITEGNLYVLHHADADEYFFM